MYKKMSFLMTFLLYEVIYILNNAEYFIDN